MQKKNPHAQALGRLGGKARMDALSPKKRKELASQAGRARAKKLSAHQRQKIAKVAVAARERRRAERNADANS
jgi:hypothetical protein